MGRMREVQDHYFREAKREGFLSRAAYKLIEIDERRRALAPGDRVLDVGAAPGSWMQVAHRRVGPRGFVVGIDLQPIAFRPGANARVFEADFTAIDPAALLEPLRSLPPRRSDRAGEIARYDAVISDMAPNTTGDRSSDHFMSARLCEALLDRLPAILRRGGNLVMKAYEGEMYPSILARSKSMFDDCRGFKPKASRSESVEMYIVAHGFRPPTGASATPRADESAPAPGVAPTSAVRRQPAVGRGWTRRAGAPR